MTRPGLLLLAVAGILWGGGGPAGRMLAESGSLSSFEVAAGRTGLGGALLVLAALALRRLRLGQVLRHRGTYITAVTMAAFQGFYFAAVATGPISIATLVTIGAAPILVTALEVVTGRLRLTWGVIATRALSVAGLALLVGAPGAGTPVSALSVLLALGASASFALMTFFGTRTPGTDASAGDAPGTGGTSAVNTDGPITGTAPGTSGPATAPPSALATTGVAFLMSGTLLALGSAVTGDGSLPGLPGPALGWLVVLGALCTAIPYACYFHGLSRESASAGSLLALLEPVTGTLIAVLAFGESVSPIGYAGILVLLTGVALATRGGQHRVLTAPPANPRLESSPH